MPPKPTPPIPAPVPAPAPAPTPVPTPTARPSTPAPSKFARLVSLALAALGIMFLLFTIIKITHPPAHHPVKHAVVKRAPAKHAVVHHRLSAAPKPQAAIPSEVMAEFAKDLGNLQKRIAETHPPVPPAVVNNINIYYGAPAATLAPSAAPAAAAPSAPVTCHCGTNFGGRVKLPGDEVQAP